MPHKVANLENVIKQVVERNMSQTVELREVRTEDQQSRQAEQDELITEHVTHISQDETVEGENLPGDFVETEEFSSTYETSTKAYAEITVDTSGAAKAQNTVESSTEGYGDMTAGTSQQEPAPSVVEEEPQPEEGPKEAEPAQDLHQQQPLLPSEVVGLHHKNDKGHHHYFEIKI